MPQHCSSDAEEQDMGSQLSCPLSKLELQLLDLGNQKVMVIAAGKSKQWGCVLFMNNGYFS